jgi:hypothetical protein
MDFYGMGSGKFHSRWVIFTNLSPIRGENGLSPPALPYSSYGIGLALISSVIQLRFKH